MIFCHKENNKEDYENKFSGFNNVEIVCSKEEINFEKFNEILIDVLPKEIPIQKVETKAEQDEE